MKARRMLMPALAFGLMMAGCSHKQPMYEGVAQIGFYSESTDLKFETSFIKAERFLTEVFARLSDSELTKLSGDEDAKLTQDAKIQLYRHLSNQMSARRTDKSKQIEVCFLHADADFAAEMANKIAEVYLSVKTGEAYMLSRAETSEKPIKE